MPDTDASTVVDESYQGVHMPPGTPYHQMLVNDRATRWMGAHVLLADHGHAKISMVIRPEMTNGFDIAHGGMIFALADTCFAMACNHPQGDDGTVTVASGADINFLKPATTGDEVVAEATLVTQTGRSGVYDVVVSTGEDTIAVFRGRSRTIPAPTPESTH